MALKVIKIDKGTRGLSILKGVIINMQLEWYCILL